MEDDLRCKDDLQACRMWLMSSNEISSVALLSPACIDFIETLYFHGDVIYQFKTHN